MDFLSWGAVIKCCGKNSAKLTFNNTIDKVRAKIKNVPLIRDAIAVHSKDEAERTCISLIESSISDLVVAFQRVCECVYPQLEGALSLKRNVFQRINDCKVCHRKRGSIILLSRRKTAFHRVLIDTVRYHATVGETWLSDSQR